MKTKCKKKVMLVFVYFARNHSMSYHIHSFIRFFSDFFFDYFLFFFIFGFGGQILSQDAATLRRKVIFHLDQTIHTLRANNDSECSTLVTRTLIVSEISSDTHVSDTWGPAYVFNDSPAV